MKFYRAKAVLLSVAICSLLSPSTTFGKNLSPSSDLLGIWEGTSEVSAPFKKGQYPSKDPADLIEVQITINADGSVNGKIGNATFVDCRIYRNRGWIGRKLNLYSDYIIKGGFLNGKVAPNDKETKRNFTIPFNLEDGIFSGGFMVIKKWKYPNPLFPRLELKKNS